MWFLRLQIIINFKYLCWHFLRNFVYFINFFRRNLIRRFKMVLPNFFFEHSIIILRLNSLYLSINFHIFLLNWLWRFSTKQMVLVWSSLNLNLIFLDFSLNLRCSSRCHCRFVLNSSISSCTRWFRQTIIFVEIRSSLNADCDAISVFICNIAINVSYAWNAFTFLLFIEFERCLRLYWFL